MDKATLTGVVTFLTVFIGAIILSTDMPLIFLDISSIMIVLGGTFGSIAITYSGKQLRLIFKLGFQVFRPAKDNLFELIKEIVYISEQYSKDPNFLKRHKKEVVHPILKSGISLHIEGLGVKEILVFLEERIDAEITRNIEEASYFKVIAKFPPAFGMIGTLIGLVIMLSTMGEDTAIETLGPAMSIALITTFYGSVVANMIVIPIYECLSLRAIHMATEQNTALKGLEFIINSDNPFFIQEKLHSYLPEKERENFLTVSASRE